MRAAVLAYALLALGMSSRGVGLSDRVVADAASSRPLVVHVFVALCDNQYQGIVPVPARLGNGRDPAGNLYWGARYGVLTYFDRAAGWKREPYAGRRPSGVLDRAVFSTTARGTRLVLVADAWEGSQIARTTRAFLEAASGRGHETVAVGGEQIEAGGRSHLVVLLGHNGLMDFRPPVLDQGEGQPARGAVVLACASQP
jgi:hypothetical protein